MSGEDLRQHLTEHYAAQRVPDERARRLASLVEMQREPDRRSPAHHRLYCPPLVSGLAACLVLCAFGAAYFAWEAREAHRQIAALKASVEAMSELEPASTRRLVALRTVAEGCPRCPLIEPLYDELERDFGDQAVFVTVDLTSPKAREQVQYLAEELEMPWVAGQCCESGMIRLVDREARKVLCTLQNREQMPQMRNAFARALQTAKP